MQFDTIAHIGAGKCGSSALQAYLSAHPELSNRAGAKLYYGALSRGGFVPPEEMPKLLNKSINGYISSVGSEIIEQIPPVAKERIINALRKFPAPLMMSHESWFAGMRRPGGRLALLELLSARGARSVGMIAYVRAPVKWINSAWWQWGAWLPNVNFQQWLDGAIRSCTWLHPARAVAMEPGVAAFQLRPVLGDVVSQFLDAIDCETPASASTASNRSLPKEFLELFKHAPDLRPGPHVVNADFIALRAIAHSEHSYTPTPWVLDMDQVTMILKRTRQSNMAILDMMSEEDRNAVIADPAWWDAGAYTRCSRVDPFQLPAAAPEDLLPMGADLMRLLRRAMWVVARNGLLGELDNPLPPHWSPERETPCHGNGNAVAKAKDLGATPP